MHRQKSFMKTKFKSYYIAGIIAFLTTILVPMINTVIGGNMIGENALSVINIISPVTAFGNFLGGLVSYGIPILYVNAISTYHKEEADRIYSLGIVSCIVISILYFTVLILFGNIYVKSYETTADVQAMIAPYFFWIKAYCLILPFFLLLFELVMIDGNEHLASVASVSQVTVTTAVSMISCRILGTGGLGFGVFTGTFAAILILLLHYRSDRCSLHFVRSFQLKQIPGMVSFSIVDSSMSLFCAISVSVLNRFVISEFGAQYLPIISVYYFIFEIAVMFDGIAYAINPIISVYAGEGNITALNDLMKYASKLAVCFGLAVSIVLLLTAPLFPAILGYDSPNLYKPTVFAIRVLSLVMVPYSLNYEYSTYYNTEAKFGIAIGMCALRDMIFQLGFGLVLGYRYGLAGLSVGIALSVIFSDLAVMLYVLIRNRKYAYPRLYIKEKDTTERHIYSLLTSENEIISVLNNIRDELTDHDIDPILCNKICLVSEEGLMLIREQNKDRDILAECTLSIGQQIELVFRDSGVIFDMTDCNQKMDTFRQYFWNKLTNSYGNKRYLLTCGYNRNIFVFPMNHS